MSGPCQDCHKLTENLASVERCWIDQLGKIHRLWRAIFLCVTCSRKRRYG